MNSQWLERLLEFGAIIGIIGGDFFVGLRFRITLLGVWVLIGK